MKSAYDRLHTDLAAAGYTAFEPSAELAAPARAHWPDHEIVFFGRRLFGLKLLSYRGFVIRNDTVLEF